MLIVRPQIVSEVRARDGEMSPGDSVTTLVRPGLLQFLQLRDETRAIGDWWSPEYTIPLTSAVTSGHQLTHIASRPDLGEWTPWSYSADWRRPMAADEAVTGDARLETVTETTRKWTFQIRSVERGDDIASGTMVSVPIRPTSTLPLQLTPPSVDHADPYESLDSVHEPLVTLLDLSPPVRVSATAVDMVHQFSPGLLHLLMNPVAGSTDPFGRRSHPLGSVHLGAAIFSARSFIGPAPLARSELIFHSPMRLPSPRLLALCRREEAEGRFTCTLVQNAVALSTARLWFGVK